MLLGIDEAYVTTCLIVADASQISELGEVCRGGERGRKSSVRGQGPSESNPNTTTSVVQVTVDIITDLFLSLEKSENK